MKKDAHLPYYDEVEVTCVCGNTFTTGSTKEKLEVEICSQCHPFYTGKQKLVDSTQKVEKFKAKREAQKELAQHKKGRKVKKQEQAKKQNQQQKEK